MAWLTWKTGTVCRGKKFADTRGHSRTLADTRGQSYEDNFSLEIVHGYHDIDIIDY